MNRYTIFFCNEVAFQSEGNCFIDVYIKLQRIDHFLGFELESQIQIPVSIEVMAVTQFTLKRRCNIFMAPAKRCNFTLNAFFAQTDSLRIDGCNIKILRAQNGYWQDAFCLKVKRIRA